MENSKDFETQYVDPEDVNLPEGTFLVKLARKAVENYLVNGVVIEPPEDTPIKLYRLGASFVTILKRVGDEKLDLRGCIGYVKPVEPLVSNVIHAAIAAATEDPRFTPLRHEELDEVIFEVSILSKMEKLADEPELRVKSIYIGRDGLMIEYGFYHGILLPEVPVEYCWDNETFLAETCLKAGMEPDCWLNKKVKVYRYRTKTFKELAPKGDVIERKLREEYEKTCKHML